jgi:truncated hemoglobin YjbI
MLRTKTNPCETKAKDHNASDTEPRVCPFEPKRGYATADSRREFARYWLSQNDSMHGDNDNNNNNNGTTTVSLPDSLSANLDIAQPLYFWQLYSILGHTPIIEIVTDFYRRVYADHDNEWFRGVFARISGPNHHIATQAAYWMDSFGGGKVYHGGNYRLNFHHTYNAREIMTARGATRWMYHMTNALNGYEFEKKFPHDPRIKPCIVWFLKFKMMKYAQEHDWTFQDGDFLVLEEATKKQRPKQQQLQPRTDVVEHVQGKNNPRVVGDGASSAGKLSTDEEGGSLLVSRGEEKKSEEEEEEAYDC